MFNKHLLAFQVKQMVVLGISQSKASNAMAIFGAFEIVSRLITSYVGDYFKGRILYAYVAFSLCLSVLNFVAAYAHNFGHMLAYGVGQYQELSQFRPDFRRHVCCPSLNMSVYVSFAHV